MTLTQILFVWLAFINLVAFALFGIDKRRAIKNRWRLKEATLFLSALLGGALGALAGMRVFRHKTQKIKFIVGIPATFVLNVACVVAMFVWVL